MRRPAPFSNGPSSVISAVVERAPAMRAMVLELTGLEEGDDRRLAVGTDHHLALDRDVGTGVLRIARVIEMLDPDDLAFAAGNGVRRWRGWGHLAGAQQCRDSEGSKEEQGLGGV